MEVAGDVAVKSLAAVSDDIIPYFTAAARDLIAVEKENAKDVTGNDTLHYTTSSINSLEAT
jgi:hypothetical protein